MGCSFGRSKIGAPGFPKSFLSPRIQTGDRCRIAGRGFDDGPTETRSPLVSTLVWIKPGGRSDGAIDENSANLTLPRNKSGG